MIVLMGLMYFGAAGTFRYWQAWIYMGILLIPMFFMVAYLLRRDPGLLERRMRMKEREREQKLITKIASIFFLAYLILPALTLPPLLAARIRNEEKVLSAGLEGYNDYMRKVRYRLIPGIW